MKYDIAEMREGIIDAMNKDWPFDLNRWDQLDRIERCVDPASLLAFAKRYNLHNVRALALYELARFERSSKLKYYSQGFWTRCYEAKAHQLFKEDRDDLDLLVDLQQKIFSPHTPGVGCNGWSQIEKDILDKRDCLRATLRSHDLAASELNQPQTCDQCDRMRRVYWENLHKLGAGGRQSVLDSFRETSNHYGAPLGEPMEGVC